MASLGTLLVESGTITQKQFDEALQSQVLFGGSIGTNLIELGYLTEGQLSDALAKQLGIPTIPADRLENIDRAVIGRVSPQLAREYYAIPFDLNGDDLRVAMADPRDPVAVQQISLKTGLKVRPYVIAEVRIAYLLEKYYGIRREQRYVTIAKPAKDAAAYPSAGFLHAISKTPAPRAESPSGRDLPVIRRRETSLAPRPASKAGKPETKAEPRRRMTAAELEERLKKVESRDDVAQLVLDFSRGYLKRSILFVVKRDIAFGWAGFGDRISPETVRGLMLPLSQPSVFELVYRSHGHYLGTVSSTPVNNRFFSAIGNVKPLTVLVLPVIYRNSLIALLYGDNGDAKGVSPARAADLQILTARVGSAFELLLRKLKAQPPAD